MKKSLVILMLVVAAVVAAGVGVLTWWLLRNDDDVVTVIELEGNGLGQLPHTAALTRIPKAGDMFWLFYPTISESPTSKPILLWLDGVLGVSPSLLANFGMFGPFDINMNRREDSWIKDFNLLFIDAPLGTGFSTISEPLPEEITLEQNAEYLQHTLETFYSIHENYRETPLYIVGQGHGAQLAVSFAKKVNEEEHENQLKGVIIGNGIISEALVLTRLGNYLEEWGYIDNAGREYIESLSKECNDLVQQERFEESFSRFLDIAKVVNEEAGAIAINLGRIVEKVSNDTEDFVFYKNELRYVFPGIDTTSFMNNVVAPALGISGPAYDKNREDVIDLFKKSFMKSSVDTVEYLLQNTDLRVTIYNGNLDAVSNTPGQLLWVDNLQWSGQEEFKKSRRAPFVLSRVLEGHYRQTDRLAFYWINAAGFLTPFDSPAAIHRVIEKTTTPDETN